MSDLIGFILIVLGIVFGVPTLIAMNLYSRIRRLRNEVEHLEHRLSRVETLGSSHLQVGGPHLQVGGPHPQAEGPKVQIPRPPEATSPAPKAAPPPAPIVAPPVVPPADALPPKGGSFLPPLPEYARRPADQPEESLESRIGGRWLLNIGIALIVLGVAYFEKLAIDKGWINETARVIQGGVLGAALIFAGSRFARKGYALYGQMLAGGGVAILYVSIYAAFLFYHLIERGPAYALMVGVTALGAWLADRHESQGLAVLAVGGGFMTPFLLRGNTDAQVALFTYLAIMVGGTVFLARRRAWPLLNVMSYLFTMLTIAGWADRYYTPAKYLVTEIYLTAFCAMFVTIAWKGRRTNDGFAQFASWFLWTAPIAYYVASLVILADHSMALLVWIIGLALLGGVLSVVAAGGAELVVWFAAALPLVGWASTHGGAAWLMPGLISVAAVYGIALAALLRQAGTEERLTGVQTAWLHLSALLMFAAAYLLVEPVRLAATGPMAAAFAVWQALLAIFFWTRARDRAIHFAALAFTMLAIAIALQFDGPAVTIGWAAEGAAIVALGLHVQRGWMRLGGGALFAVATVQTLDLLLSTAPANHVVLFNPRAACALTAIGLCYAIAWLHRRATDLSDRDGIVGTTLIAAQVLSVVLLTSEIHAYFATREGVFAREMMVSVTWAVYATTLIVIGLLRRYAPIRYFAIGLFGITILKVFFSDLAELQRMYRVMSVIGLGLALLLTSYLYQRMRGTLLGNDTAE